MVLHLLCHSWDICWNVCARCLGPGGGTDKSCYDAVTAVQDLFDGCMPNWAHGGDQWTAPVVVSPREDL